MKKSLALLPILAIALIALSSCASRPEAVPQRPDIHGFISRVEYGGNVAYVLAQCTWAGRNGSP